MYSINIQLFLHPALRRYMSYFPAHVGSLLLGHQGIVSLFNPQVLEGIGFGSGQLEDVMLVQPMYELRETNQI